MKAGDRTFFAGRRCSLQKNTLLCFDQREFCERLILFGQRTSIALKKNPCANIMVRRRGHAKNRGRTQGAAAICR
jgi:hypothetical protein